MFYGLKPVKTNPYPNFQCLRQTFLMYFIHKWATATVKIASLSLFAENNSGATPPVTDEK